MKLLIFLILFLTVSCEPKGKMLTKQMTPGSCLEKEMIYDPYSGGCVSGNGVKGADARFLLFPNAPILERLSEDEIEVCLVYENYFEDRLEEYSDYIKRAIDAWLQPLKDLAPSLPTTINISRFEVNMIPHEEKFPECSGRPTIYLEEEYVRNGDTNRAHAFVYTEEIWLYPDDNYGVVLHEFGHFFGLADSYIEGHWVCRNGFPNSIMCDPQWNVLLDTDIQQIQRNYCLSINGENSSCFNHKPEALTHFLPEKHGRPYFECFGKDGEYAALYPFYFYSNLASFDRDNQVFTVYNSYSQDTKSIKETISGDQYVLDLEVFHQDGDAFPTMDWLRLQLGKTELSFSYLEDAGTLGFCTFDENFLSYLEKQGGPNLDNAEIQKGFAD